MLLAVVGPSAVVVAVQRAVGMMVVAWGLAWAAGAAGPAAAVIAVVSVTVVLVATVDRTPTLEILVVELLALVLLVLERLPLSWLVAEVGCGYAAMGVFGAAAIELAGCSGLVVLAAALVLVGVVHFPWPPSLAPTSTALLSSRASSSVRSWNM